MRIVINNSIPVEKLVSLFTKCFDKLIGNDDAGFNTENSQSFREWFGVEYLSDY